MTVSVSKPPLNLREELSSLKKPSGVKGEELLRANTVADAYTALNPSMFRNRWINGKMEIAQRTTSAVTMNNSGAFPVDRFQGYGQGNGQWTAQQSSDVPTGQGFQKSVVCTVTTTANTATDTNATHFLGNYIEGYNAADLMWGTGMAKPITVSFWVKSSVPGNYALTSTTGMGTNRGIVKHYTINQKNTWEYKTVTIPGSTLGGDTDWSKTNGRGLGLWWGLGSYSSWQGSLDVWSTYANGIFGSSTSTSWISNSGATFYITGVQVEAGTMATPFEHRSFGTELALCQRYYEKSYDLGTALGANTSGIIAPQIQSGTNYFNNGLPRWMVEKRSTPTVVIYNSSTGTVNSLYNTDTGGNVSISSLTGVNTKGFQYIYSSSTTASAGQRLEYHYTVSAEL